MKLEASLYPGIAPSRVPWVLIGTQGKVFPFALPVQWRGPSQLASGVMPGYSQSGRLPCGCLVWTKLGVVVRLYVESRLFQNLLPRGSLD